MTCDDGSASVGTPDQLGAYELVKPLAQGGMASVYLARTGGEIERHVAVKVLCPQRALDADACALFLDEARVVSLLHHQNIATVHDVDVEAGHHYLAMEYIHGADLRELLLVASRQGALPSYEVSLAIVAQAAAGLHHAHTRCGADGQPLHLVHRDVSLSNIMVGHDGAVKVVDFGIARSVLSTVHTSPGVVRGKASYMSPEQCLGDKVDHRTDVFALGIVLYELTTGARCFAGKTDFDRMLAVVRGDYLRPSDLVAEYPLELEQVVRTALATDPELRYPSCAAMLEAIERVMKGRGWVGGASAIRKAMHEMFGEVREPWLDDATDVVPPSLIAAATAAEDAAPCTVESVVILPIPAAPPTLKITRPTRLARGTLADMFDPRRWSADDDEALTRGRRSLRRASVPHLAA